MAKSKYLEKIQDLFKKSLVVDFKSIERIVSLNNKKQKSNYAKLLVSNLLKQEKIKKIAKGYYTKYNDNSLTVFCYQPSYLGLQSALSFHGLWEQETIPIIITSKKIRTGIRKVLGGNVLIKRTQNKFIFGIDYFKDGSFYLPYSDIEKTFIDMIIFKQKIPLEVLENFRKKIDEKKLKKYLKKYSKKTTKIVLNKYLTH